MEFCCEEKLTEKKDFIERETKKYEYVEDEEVIEDFGQVMLPNSFKKFIFNS